MSSDLVRLSPSEDSFIARVLKSRKRPLAEAVPDDIDPREALANVAASVSAVRKLGDAQSSVGAYLGRHMAIIAKRREIYEAAGYESFNEYEKAEILDKIGRSTAWKYKLVSEEFPTLSLDDVSKLRATNLERAAKAARSIKASPAQKQKLLEKAAEMPIAEYKEWVENESGLSAPGATSTAVFELIGTGEQITELREFLGDPRFVAFAETDAALGMVLAAIKSSTVDWPDLEDWPPSKSVHDGQPDGEQW